jgi:hypothetical protein
MTRVYVVRLLHICVFEREVFERRRWKLVVADNTAQVVPRALVLGRFPNCGFGVAVGMTLELGQCKRLQNIL